MCGWSAVCKEEGGGGGSGPANIPSVGLVLFPHKLQQSVCVGVGGGGGGVGRVTAFILGSTPGCLCWSAVYYTMCVGEGVGAREGGGGGR